MGNSKNFLLKILITSITLVDGRSAIFKGYLQVETPILTAAPAPKNKDRTEPRDLCTDRFICARATESIQYVTKTSIVPATSYVTEPDPFFAPPVSKSVLETMQEIADEYFEKRFDRGWNPVRLVYRGKPRPFAGIQDQKQIMRQFPALPEEQEFVYRSKEGANKQVRKKAT